MKIVELPTNGEWDSWSYVLADPPPEGSWQSICYSGAFSVVDGAKAEDITAERIARVDLWFGESPEGHGSQDFATLVELTDGTWATCMAWCDTTGWDCRSEVQWKVAPDRQTAISQGLSREARRMLGVPLEGEDVS